MIGLILILTTTAARPATYEVATPEARILTQVRASVYTYEVTNMGSDPITHFEVAYSDGYSFQVPEGWDYSEADGLFRAWVVNNRRAIYPGHTGKFWFRVTSKGAVLGHVPARVETDAGASISIANVWGAVPEPRGHILLVAGVVLVIFVLHSLLLTRRERRLKPPSDRPSPGSAR